MSEVIIYGHLPAKFEALRSTITQNYAEHEELGFQFCVMQNGKTLIDIGAGWTDRRRTQSVNENTLFAVFSSGKAAAALVIAWLVEQDRIGYDQLVATIWPEFAQAGKESLTIGQLMSHQAGLSGITNPDWTPKDWFDWNKTTAQLEQQSPIFPPASASGYHPVTYGFLAGEIARRADSDQRSLGRILREELCQAAGADVWIGLPPSEHERCAQMQKPKALADMGEITEATRWAFLKPWSPITGSTAMSALGFSDFTCSIISTPKSIWAVSPIYPVSTASNLIFWAATPAQMSRNMAISVDPPPGLPHPGCRPIKVVGRTTVSTPNLCRQKLAALAPTRELATVELRIRVLGIEVVTTHL